jgi:hypothetical protein
MDRMLMELTVKEFIIMMVVIVMSVNAIRIGMESIGTLCQPYVDRLHEYIKSKKCRSNKEISDN